jgi:hypothetical protein
MEVGSLKSFKYKALLTIDRVGFTLTVALILFSAAFGLIDTVKFFKEVLVGFIPFLFHVGVESGALNVIGWAVLSILIWWFLSRLIVDKKLKSMNWNNHSEKTELKNVILFKTWNTYFIFGFSKWLIGALSVLIVAPLYSQALYPPLFGVIVSLSFVGAVGASFFIFMDYRKPSIHREYHPDTHSLFLIWLSSMDGIWDIVSDQEMSKIPVDSNDYKIASYLASKVRDKNENAECEIKFDVISNVTIDDYLLPYEISFGYSEEELG